MKKIKTALVVIFYLLLSTFNLSAQGVGINSTGVAPDASALLDLSSTNKGLLITRVDTADISSPAFGLITLSPTDTCLYLYNGKKWISIGGGGNNCSLSGFTPPPPPPAFPCGGTVIPIVDVTSTTGKVWMDRNLGASQVATSSTDAASYGDLYQWGRCSDGHEKRNSGTTTITSFGNNPGHGNFITRTGTNPDWRKTKNDNLWQGVNGINNPCPSGYRLPTWPELESEYKSWGTSNKNSAGAFASALKLTASGYRYFDGRILHDTDGYGYYWSSTVASNVVRILYLKPTTIKAPSNHPRSYGTSVRCIKD